MALALAAMMSRTGILLAVVMMFVFCYRLILREEGELESSQGEIYRAYLKTVPRILPSWSPRTASAGSRAAWDAGFKAELWYWGFAVALAAFALTLDLKLFFGAM